MRIVLRIAPNRLKSVVGFSFVGLVLLWWAFRQWATMGVGASELASHWRVLGWMATLIAAGISFGLAAAFARADVSTANATATVVAGLLPLAVVVHFWAIFAFDWLPSLFNEFRLFLMSKEAVVGSCFVFGFLVSNLLSYRVGRLKGRWLVEVSD